MSELRKGRQTPTASVVLPYKKTYGQEAIDLYNSTGKTAQEWQELLIYDMLSVNDDELWVHTKFGYSIPRRNGKSEVLLIREFQGLKKGEQILHTAHRTPTSHSAWEKLCNLLEKSGLKEGKDFKTLKQFGLETIELFSTGGRVNFRTRSSKGGLGEGYDLLVIDEAQEYTDDQEAALKYVVTSSLNPQTVFCGTPPTLTSSGTVFTKFRNNTLQGKGINSFWAEWSVEDESDVKDKELWYECNPSLGTIFTERSVIDEIGTDDLDFNIQRLGLWLKYNQKSAISKKEWKFLECDELPKLVKGVCVGIKYGQDGTNVAMSVACKTEDNKVFIEAIDCQNIRSGNKWIVEYLTKMNTKQIVVDGANGQALLLEELKANKVKNVVAPTVKEIIIAHSSFEQGLYSQNICHMEQPSLERVVSNCEKRHIGSNGGFGYKSQKEDIEIALLDSVVLAYWSCINCKEKRKQKISY